jgi:hypothetical protein
MMKQIDQLYNMLTGSGTAKLGQDKDGESDIISKLVYIESKVHHLIEVKEYLTGGLKLNDV